MVGWAGLMIGDGGEVLAMAWMAKITGDMTLSVVDQAGLSVLGVEMLRMNTMRAGDGGELLVRTWNDLHLLATAASRPDWESLKLEDPSGGLSPRPWSVEFLQAARCLRVRDAQADGYSRPSAASSGLVAGERRFDNHHGPPTPNRLLFPAARVRTPVTTGRGRPYT